MLIPTASAAPGASSQPAEIRGGSGMGASRLRYSSRAHRTGVSGLGCDNMLDIGYDGDDTTPCLGISVDDPAVTSPGPPATMPVTINGISTMGSPGAVFQPTNTGLNIGQAIAGLNNTLAIAQGGSVVTAPNGATSIQGSSAAATTAAAAAALANPVNQISSMIVPIMMIGGLVLVMSMVKK